MQFSTHDPPIYPKCLQLVHGTRVCQLRVDEGRFMVNHVMPLMLAHHPDFEEDLVLFNFGCGRWDSWRQLGGRIMGQQAGLCRAGLDGGAVRTPVPMARC